MLFEGKSDIILLKKAVEYFRKNVDGYENISVDRDFEFYLIVIIHKSNNRVSDRNWIYFMFVIHK